MRAVICFYFRLLRQSNEYRCFKRDVIGRGNYYRTFYRELRNTVSTVIDFDCTAPTALRCTTRAPRFRCISVLLIIRPIDRLPSVQPKRSRGRKGSAEDVSLDSPAMEHFPARNNLARAKRPGRDAIRRSLRLTAENGFLFRRAAERRGARSTGNGDRARLEDRRATSPRNCSEQAGITGAGLIRELSSRAGTSVQDPGPCLESVRPGLGAADTVCRRCCSCSTCRGYAGGSAVWRYKHGIHRGRSSRPHNVHIGPGPCPFRI